MTREEAIQYAEKKLDSASYRLEMGYLNNGLRQIVSNEYEFFRQALSALRQQEPVIKCNDLFDEDGGDIYPENDSICSGTNLPCCRCNPGPCDHRLEPVTERHELNDPLTLDELRKMSGEPVWVEHYHGGEWIVVHWNVYGRITTAYNAELRYDEYGERWLAYRQMPEEGTV